MAGIFYNSLPAYETDELLAELRGMRVRYLETAPTKPENWTGVVVWLSRGIFEKHILSRLKDELRRRGVDPGEETIVDAGW
jgi:hypothetical protein